MRTEERAFVKSSYKTVRDMLYRSFGKKASLVSRAPGRVNLIGDHTDYNEGLVLPMALQFETVVAFSANENRKADSVVSIVSEGFEPVQFSLEDDPGSVPGWGRYVAGMARLLAEEGADIKGFSLAVCSDIPRGSGLSSSAALEMAVGMALSKGFSFDISGERLAHVGQQVEHQYVDVACGIMDQLVSVKGLENSAVLIDCQTLETKPYSLFKNASFVLFDTNTPRELEISEYSDRRAVCEQISHLLRVSSLRYTLVRDLDVLQVSELKRQKARHVVTEIERTAEAAHCLSQGDVKTFGSLMSESHRSLRDDFVVSTEALDMFVEIAESVDGCFGARMTGGGFGGCGVALVENTVCDEFISLVSKRYQSELAIVPQAWIAKASPGASTSFI